MSDEATLKTWGAWAAVDFKGNVAFDAKGRMVIADNKEDIDDYIKRLKATVEPGILDTNVMFTTEEIFICLKRDKQALTEWLLSEEEAKDKLDG